MGFVPGNKLDPRIKNTWRIADAILVALLALPVLIPLFAVAFSLRDNTVLAISYICTLLTVVIAVFVVVVLPAIRYARWGWEVTDEFLTITKGIIWRRTTTVPFIRVQNTDTRQGPLMRMYGLADVTVSTAAGEHVIPGLAAADADALRDRAAELARIAREDI